MAAEIKSQPASSKTSKIPATAQRRPILFFMAVSMSCGLAIPFLHHVKGFTQQRTLQTIENKARHFFLHDDGSFAHARE